MTPAAVRIQKALADAGVASRRAAEELVAAGRVTVNGEAATIGQRVDPARDEISVDGQPVVGRPEPVYLALAKPAGVTSTVSDRHAVRTVVQLVPEEIRRRAMRIYPVGRLDRDSEGLLLLTNDGEWAQRLLHPSHEVEREYAVGLARPVDEAQQRRLRQGIELDEGLGRLDTLRPATSAEVRRVSSLIGRDAGPLTWYLAVIRQGWRRQLRRMFAAVGAPVERLVRLRIGSLRLGSMKLGDVRQLSAAERRRLEGLAAGQGAGRRSAPRAGLVVSLDGPGSSGKSTVGSAAAQALGYRFCDTGVLYRGLTWLALERRVDPNDADSLVGLVDRLELTPDAQDRFARLLVNGRDVTRLLHTHGVDAHVSQISRHAPVRNALLPIQRRLAAEGRIIMAGRDIGTVVLPDADLKLFLHVSVEERARRRAADRGVSRDDPAAVEAIERELRRRDGIDSTRNVAPLRVPDGATVIDTERNTVEQTIAEVVRLVRAAEGGGTAGSEA
jgi:23S rRNA pseudouridine2605 synthase